MGYVDNILAKVGSTPTFKPASVNTFGDWSIEAGDIVSVVTEEGTETVPIFDSSMTWKGSSETQISASGNTEREVQEKAERQMYSAMGGIGSRVDDAITRIVDAEGRIIEIESDYQDLSARTTNTEASLELKADEVRVTELNGRVSTIEASEASLSARVDGAEASLRLKAEKSTVDSITQSVAEISADVVELNAFKTNIDGRLTVGETSILKGDLRVNQSTFVRDLTIDTTMKIGTSEYAPTSITFIKGQDPVTILAI